MQKLATIRATATTSLSRLGICFLALVPQIARTQTPVTNNLAPATAAAVDAAVEVESKKQGIIGVAVGIIQHGQIVYLKGYGDADREKHIPVTTKTVFNWASNSKPLAAVAALQLEEKNLINLDADVRKYVPEFPDKGAVITARQLLCHQSGLPHYENGKVIPTTPPESAVPAFETPLRALDRFNQSPLLFKPGEKISYSGYGYILLSAIVERAGKESFTNQIRERIAGPLGMTSLQLDLPTPQSDWAAGYEKNSRGKWQRMADPAEYWKYGAGGFKSNIEDFARWAEALINRRLISKQTEEMMWTVQKTSSGIPIFPEMDFPFGLGFQIEDHEGELKISHNGGGQGVTTRMAIYPREKHGIVMMCNCISENPGDWTDLTAISGRIYNALNEVHEH